MTVDSANIYRASPLAWPTRVLCWPLAIVLLVTGVVWRFFGMLWSLVRHGTNPERGLPDGWACLKDYTLGGLRYLTFRNDHLPAISGRVHRAGDTPGPWWEAKRRLKKSHVAMVSVIIFVVYVYVGLLSQAGVIAEDYRATTKEAEFLQPGERGFLLGTDQLGRDVWSLMLRGTTTALWIGLFAATISSFLGMILGAIAGYFGGWVDDVIVWAYTTLSAIPYLLLLMAFSFVFRNNEDIASAYKETFLYADWEVSMGLFTIILAIGLTSWVGTCRVVRAEFIKHRDRDYVLVARSMGLPTHRVIFRHVLPNVFHLVLITFSLLFIGAIKFEVILSFLGLGLEPSEASWGNMISKGAGELLRAKTVWWQITSATAALFGLVLSVNLFADAMRDALDPRLRK